jgi:flavin reductase (DIM6/NTAB) family NADH-FMN oxidoreductase RutF
MNHSHTEHIFRLLDREVWIVTAAASGRRGGLAATWVSPASIDQERPVLLAGIATNHFTAELIDASGSFAAHLLRTDQVELAWNFAGSSGRSRDKFGGLATAGSDTGPPILADCLAWLECRVLHRYDTGDRLFYWADVILSAQHGPGPALREEAFIRGLSDEQRRQLAANRDADIGAQRPWHESWRRQLANLPAPAASFRES